MGKPYPLEFRKRVVAAVESGGQSCNQAAKQLGIGISTAIGWVNRLRETGTLAPGQMGGHKLSRPEALRQSMIALMDGQGYVGSNGETEFAYAHPLFCCSGRGRRPIPWPPANAQTSC